MVIEDGKMAIDKSIQYITLSTNICKIINELIQKFSRMLHRITKIITARALLAVKNNDVNTLISTFKTKYHTKR